MKLLCVVQLSDGLRSFVKLADNVDYAITCFHVCSVLVQSCSVVFGVVIMLWARDLHCKCI